METIDRLKFQTEHGDPNLFDATFVNLSHFTSGNSKSRMIICFYIGAPSSGIGRNQMRRILTHTLNLSISISTSSRRFCFGDSVYNYIRELILALFTPAGVPNVFVTLYIVSAYVPAQLGLYVLYIESSYADTVTNRLVKLNVISSHQ